MYNLLLIWLRFGSSTHDTLSNRQDAIQPRFKLNSKLIYDYKKGNERK